MRQITHWVESCFLHVPKGMSEKFITAQVCPLAWQCVSLGCTVPLHSNCPERQAALLQHKHFKREKTAQVQNWRRDLDVHMPLLCSDPKTEEFDDCDLGDCTKLEGLCFSSHQGLITADCTSRPPGVWLDLPVECQASQRLSPLCRSASNKLSLSEVDKY